jgi:quercetin dioxygenase-like cupin family protein
VNAPARHIVVRADDANFAIPAPYADLSEGFERWSPINGDSGSVHQEFGVCRLEPNGVIEPHVHSFEESVYVLSGEVVCETGEGSYLLGEGDYGVIPVAAPHAFRNAGTVTASWAEMLAPQPRLGGSGDTYPVAMPVEPGPARAVDARDPRARSFGNIRPENMRADLQSQNLLALSASMRTALLVYSGIMVKMMVDSDLGSSLSTMFMVQYEPAGVAGAHDHPHEETFLILEGETVARFDGEEHLLRPGDVAWAGVGCIHEFSNPNDTVVRWLETQAPQPPARYSYRFARDWTYLEAALDAETGADEGGTTDE